MNVEKTFLGALTAILIFISFLMVAPFLGYIITALILAFVLKPAQNRLEKFIPPGISAALLIIIFIAAVIAPFGFAFGAVIGDATEVINSIDETETFNFTELEELILEYTGEEIDVDTEIQKGIERFTNIAVGGLGQLLNVVTSIAIGLLIMLFALFYLLKDGEKLLVWLKSVTPVSKDIQNELYSRASLMTRGVLKGHVLVAIVEGLIGGLGLYLTGVPNFAFWTFIMILLAFIPIVGAFMVWAPAAAYLVITGNVIPGVLLAAYGITIISLSDNILRPYLVDRRADIHPGAILVGVIGGVYVFGAVGLFIGPVIFGFSKTVLEVFMNNHEDL